MVDFSFLGGVFMIGLYDDEINTHQFPIGWETFSYNDIRGYFDCKSRSKDNNKPLPTVDDWEFMRELYLEVVSIEERRELAEWAVDNSIHWEDDIVPPTLGYSIEPGKPVPPPYHAKLSKGMGRGLFASRDIKEGELVHDGTVSDVIFPSAHHWRKYVFSLPRDFACDSTDWHWMQKIEEDGPNYMFAGINISSLMNSGGDEFIGMDRKPNALPRSSTDGAFYATRDIQKGEEILTDYDMYYTNWKLVGL